MNAADVDSALFLCIPSKRHFATVDVKDTFSIPFPAIRATSATEVQITESVFLNEPVERKTDAVVVRKSLCQKESS